MYHYESPAQAIEELRKRGYDQDFNLEENCIVCDQQKFKGDEFEITEVYRFEGNSDPADESIILGIQSNNGFKGILVSAYGYASEAMNEEIMHKLKMHDNTI